MSKNKEMSMNEMGKQLESPVTIHIKNLHIHMDEHMDSTNFYHPVLDDACCNCDGCEEHGCDEIVVDMDELVQQIRGETGIPTVIIERVLAAENKFLSKLGIVTEVHVAEESEANEEDAADEDAEAKETDSDQKDNTVNAADNHMNRETAEMNAKIFPVLAGIAMVSILKALRDAKAEEEEEEEKEEHNGKKE